MEKFARRSTADHLLTSNLLISRQHEIFQSRSYFSCHYDLPSLRANLENQNKASSNSVCLGLLTVFLTRIFHLKLAPSASSTPLSRLSPHGTQRSQVVSVNGITVYLRPDTSCILEGSPLGPSLFPMYIKDALNSISHDIPFLVADDPKLEFRLNYSASPNLSGYAVCDRQNLGEI